MSSTLLLIDWERWLSVPQTGGTRRSEPCRPTISLLVLMTLAVLLLAMTTTEEVLLMVDREKANKHTRRISVPLLEQFRSSKPKRERKRACSLIVSARSLPLSGPACDCRRAL